MFLKFLRIKHSYARVSPCDQLASGYGAAYCAALETSLAAYAQDFVLDVQKC